MYTLIMAATGTRKAPIASATLFKPGTTKPGNDGNNWTIVVDKRGVQRWKLKNKPTTTIRQVRKRPEYCCSFNIISVARRV